MSFCICISTFSALHGPVTPPVQAEGINKVMVTFLLVFTVITSYHQLSDLKTTEICDLPGLWARSPGTMWLSLVFSSESGKGQNQGFCQACSPRQELITSYVRVLGWVQLPAAVGLRVTGSLLAISQGPVFAPRGCSQYSSVYYGAFL